MYSSIFITVATVPTGLQTCAKVLQMHLPVGGGTPWLQVKSRKTFKLASVFFINFLSLVVRLNIYITVATVPIELQTCAKVLQMHLPGGGGTPWLQPKSNRTFKKKLLYLFKFLTTYFFFKYFHYSGHCVHRVANLWKSAANAPSRGWWDTLVASQK